MSGESAPAEFGSFLEGLRGQGVDSSGRFTLDPKRARELLQRFQLKAPGYCLLHLVSFMVGAGLPTIRVAGEKNLLIQAPGLRLDEEWVRAPLSNLFGSRRKAHLTELAIGVHTTLGVEGTHLWIRGAELETHWWGDEHESGSRGGRTDAEFELKLAEPVKRAGLELLREHFRASPVPIEIDGEPICAPMEIPPGSLEVIWQHPDYPISLGPPTGARYRFRPRGSSLGSLSSGVC